jgi:hypothetical protein
MPLKKRRVELHTVTEQLLFIGGGRAAQGQCADCAAWDGTAEADEAAAGVRVRELFRRLESGAAYPAEELLGPVLIPDDSPPSDVGARRPETEGVSGEGVEEPAAADAALGLGPREDGGADARLRVLRDAARSLSRAMRAVRSLELSSAAAVPDVGRGVNFFDEVRRFEILLIERALLHSGGSQVRAASLLGLKTTTLNSKIKGYNINLKDLA